MFAEQVGQAGQSQLAVSHGRFVVDPFLRSTFKLLMLGQVSVNDRRAIWQLLRDWRGCSMGAAFAMIARCCCYKDILCIEETDFVMRIVIAPKRIVLDEDFHPSPL